MHRPMYSYRFNKSFCLYNFFAVVQVEMNATVVMSYGNLLVPRQFLFLEKPRKLCNYEIWMNQISHVHWMAVDYLL